MQRSGGSMPIKIPMTFPAVNILKKENIFAMDEDHAYAQDIHPLRILLLNLMPAKIVTETQLLRLLGNFPLPLEFDFMYTASYEPKNIPNGHLVKCYETFDAVQNRKYDGMIITGAPVEQMPFEKVMYWDDLCKIMDWSRKNVYSTLHICWGAQAALYHHYGIPKYDLPQKMFGVFEHAVNSKEKMLFRGFDDVFYVPHSRHTEVRRKDIEKVSGLCILSESQDAGVYAVMDKQYRHLFITGHLEYDSLALKAEYDRNALKGLPINIPANYYPDDDPQQMPVMRWRSAANLLFSNWLNYYVYQGRSSDLNNLVNLDKKRGLPRDKI